MSLLLLLLPHALAGGDRLCIRNAWEEGNYTRATLVWSVADRYVYDVWDASARWGVFGGPVSETADAARWRKAVVECGYSVSLPDKVGLIPVRERSPNIK